MNAENSKIRDRLLLLLVALLFTAYFVLSRLGLESQFGFSAWDAQFPVALLVIAVGVLLTAKFFLRARWGAACMMAVNVLIMPGVAVGEFFGAKNLLHANGVVAVLFAIPPIIPLAAVILLFVSKLVRISHKPASPPVV